MQRDNAKHYRDCYPHLRAPSLGILAQLRSSRLHPFPITRVYADSLRDPQESNRSSWNPFTGFAKRIGKAMQSSEATMKIQNRTETTRPVGPIVEEIVEKEVKPLLSKETGMNLLEGTYTFFTEHLWDSEKMDQDLSWAYGKFHSVVGSRWLWRGLLGYPARVVGDIREKRSIRQLNREIRKGYRDPKTGARLPPPLTPSRRNLQKIKDDWTYHLYRPMLGKSKFDQYWDQRQELKNESAAMGIMNHQDFGPTFFWPLEHIIYKGIALNDNQRGMKLWRPGWRPFVRLVTDHDRQLSFQNMSWTEVEDFWHRDEEKDTLFANLRKLVNPYGHSMYNRITGLVGPERDMNLWPDIEEEFRDYVDQYEAEVMSKLNHEIHPMIEEQVWTKHRENPELRKINNSDTSFLPTDWEDDFDKIEIAKLMGYDTIDGYHTYEEDAYIERLIELYSKGDPEKRLEAERFLAPKKSILGKEYRTIHNLSKNDPLRKYYPEDDDDDDELDPEESAYIDAFRRVYDQQMAWEHVREQEATREAFDTFYREIHWYANPDDWRDRADNIYQNRSATPLHSDFEKWRQTGSIRMLQENPLLMQHLITEMHLLYSTPPHVVVPTNYKISEEDAEILLAIPPEQNAGYIESSRPGLTFRHPTSTREKYLKDLAIIDTYIDILDGWEEREAAAVLDDIPQWYYDFVDRASELPTELREELIKRTSAPALLQSLIYYPEEADLMQTEHILDMQEKMKNVKNEIPQWTEDDDVEIDDFMMELMDPIDETDYILGQQYYNIGNPYEDGHFPNWRNIWEEDDDFDDWDPFEEVTDDEFQQHQQRKSYAKKGRLARFGAYYNQDDDKTDAQLEQEYLKARQDSIADEQPFWDRDTPNYVKRQFGHFSQKFDLPFYSTLNYFPTLGGWAVDLRDWPIDAELVIFTYPGNPMIKVTPHFCVPMRPWTGDLTDTLLIDMVPFIEEVDALLRFRDPESQNLAISHEDLSDPRFTDAQKDEIRQRLARRQNVLYASPSYNLYSEIRPTRFSALQLVDEVLST
eukprot:TRINITY_DN3269_c0_g1_i3.p1 TRINITY_DN3269_c0_g1~~TRINITY_DN3269_c0_g1_i3.p1  ORF type:complete len:1035 (+),score=302.46 TRINITY_DN3269_c0_g1_i3:21-3125(+)